MCEKNVKSPRFDYEIFIFFSQKNDSFLVKILSVIGHPVKSKEDV